MSDKFDTLLYAVTEIILLHYSYLLKFLNFKYILLILEADPVYKFTKLLPETSEAYTTKDGILECAVNDYKAIVTWYKDGSKIEVRLSF